VKFISTPHKLRNRANELKEVMSLVFVVAETTGAVDCLIDVSDNPVVPAPDLIAKSAEPAEVATSHRPLDRDAARCALPGRDGPRVLDHEVAFRNRHYEG
jgi:hypothetical protein